MRAGESRWGIQIKRLSLKGASQSRNYGSKPFRSGASEREIYKNHIQNADESSIELCATIFLRHDMIYFLTNQGGKSDDRFRWQYRKCNP
jgi:hypothetical protein